MSNIPKMINVKQFAKEMNEAIGIGINKVYQMVKEPGFPSVKLGGQTFVFIDKVNDWLIEKGKSQK